MPKKGVCTKAQNFPLFLGRVFLRKKNKKNIYVPLSALGVSPPAHLFKTFLMNEGEARGTEKESPVMQKHHRAINDSTYVSANHQDKTLAISIRTHAVVT